MAKEKDAFRIIPKAKSGLPWLVIVIFALSGAIAVSLVVVYFIFLNRTANLEETSQSLDEQKQLLEDSPMKKIEVSLLAFSNKINDFSRLYRSQLFSSVIFQFLRQICHNQVQFLNFNFSSEDYQLTIDGTTESFQILAEQTAFLATNREVEQAEIAELELNQEGGVDFTLRLVLDKDIFLLNQKSLNLSSPKLEIELKSESEPTATSTSTSTLEEIL